MLHVYSIFMCFFKKKVLIILIIKDKSNSNVSLTIMIFYIAYYYIFVILFNLIIGQKQVSFVNKKLWSGIFAHIAISSIVRLRLYISATKPNGTYKP